MMGPLIRYRPGGTTNSKPRPRGATASQTAVASWHLPEGLVEAARVLPWMQIGLALVVALVAGSMPWVTGQVLSAMDRDIQSIAVRGNLHSVTPKALEKSLQPWVGQSFFATDLEEVKEAIESRPWIDTAAVRRVWPGELVVEVAEQQPVAFWNGQKLLNGRGQVFAPSNPGVAGALPHLQGPESKAGEVLAKAREISDTLQSHQLRLAGLALEKRGAWTLSLDNGIEVALGRDRTEERLARFLAVYDAQLKSRAAEVARVDARYGNGVAVSWRKSATSDTDKS
ncbi:cell division protein FtsQ/DivIB [Marinobacteraceae bacterium S3BR75-40.1]